MRYLPLRRGKLVGSEGPGSLVISPEGETAIVGALDFWFRNGYGEEADAIDEFKKSEPRLKAILKVDNFYTPPEYREEKINAQIKVSNSNLVIPLLKFPQWHYCSSCKTLKKLEFDSTTSYVECPKCEQKRYFKQVPFVIVCEQGHLSDFPWKEWVHGDEKSTCMKDLRLQMSGGTTLDSWQVVCDSCKQKRSLKGITTIKKGENKTSILSEQLNKLGSKKFKCTGHKSWCGEVFEDCDEPPVAILRNSINVYMPRKISAIAIPGDHSAEVDRIVGVLNSPAKYSVRMNLARYSIMQDKISSLRDFLRMDLNHETTDEDLESAIIFLESAEEIEFEEASDVTPEKMLREKEFEKLIQRIDAHSLRIEPEWECFTGNVNHYSRYLERFSRVLRLKETSALFGFDRLNSANITQDFSSYYPRLYKNYEATSKKWLPVNEVYGEGIFLQLNLEQIRTWESNSGVQIYFQKYLSRIKEIDHRNEEILSPRNIMLHTLSHFLIDEFANTSGYNRAAIRERLYMGEDQVGVLIYISSGDSEGTFGGLVRLGTNSKFFKIIDQAIVKSQWCSSDPVCTEIGDTQGQGVNALNGSACYNCSHIPETSCEHWNTYLDRKLLIDKEIGYFKS